MTTYMQTLQSFSAVRSRLAASLTVIESVFNELGATDRANGVRGAKERLAHDAFCIMLYGEMKRGKSTLINAMLGEELLPTRPERCSAVPCTVSFGPERRAVVHLSDGASLPFNLENGTREFFDLITIPLRRDEQGESDDCRFVRDKCVSADVFTPAEICIQGLSLRDSPGLNEHPDRTASTLQALQDADAVVVTLATPAVLSTTELAATAEAISWCNLKNAFFVINQFHEMTEEEIESLARDCQWRLEEACGGPVRLYWLRAKEALLARHWGDQAALEASGIERLETDLCAHVVKSGAAEKLLGPLRVGEHTVQEGLLDVLLVRERLYRMPLEEIRERVEAAQVPLREAERQRLEVLVAFDRRTALIEREVSILTHALAAELDSGLPARISRVDVSAWQSMTGRNEAKKRMAKEVAQWAASRAEAWQDEKLAPALQTHVGELRREVTLHTEKIEAQLRAVRVKAAGIASEDGLTREEEVSAASRILGAGLGLLGGPGSILEGSSLGIGSAARGLAANIVAGTVMTIVLHLALPVVLAGLVVMGTLRVLTGAKGVADRLRANVTRELQAGLRRAFPGMEREVVGSVRAELQAERDRVGNLLNLRVHECASQMEAVLADRDAKRADLDKQLESLAAHRQTLQEQAVELAGIRRKIEGRHDDAAIAARVGIELEPKVAAALRSLQIDRGDGRGVPLPGERSLAELRALLGKNGRARLDGLGDRLAAEGRWRPDMELTLAELWSWWPEDEGTNSVLLGTYRTVTALAVTEGAIEPPPPSLVNDWLSDRVHRFALEAVGDIVVGESWLRFAEDAEGETPAEDGEGADTRPIKVDSFRKRYDRVLKVVAPRRDAYLMRRATVTHQSDRDAPRDCRG
ncbi:MAG: dynamin family protein [Phycisphaerales bacterium]|nr:dynamin family protein [Phycisphaerales bacterium]